MGIGKYMENPFKYMDLYIKPIKMHGFLLIFPMTYPNKRRLDFQITSTKRILSKRMQWRHETPDAFAFCGLAIKGMVEL